MTEIVGKTRALELLARTVEAKGADYKDTGTVHEVEGLSAMLCEYSYDGGKTPGCIVGHVLDYMGVPLSDVPSGGIDDIATTDDQETYYLYDTTEDKAKTKPIFTANALRVLRAAQMDQDDGVTWGKALGAAQQFASGLEEE